MTRTIRIADILDDLIAAADEARLKVADDALWLDAVNWAYSWLLEQDTIALGAHAVLIPSDTVPGRVYHANGACQCQSHQRGYVCKHRIRARLVIRSQEIGMRRAALADARSGEELVADLYH